MIEKFLFIISWVASIVGGGLTLVRLYFIYQAAIKALNRHKVDDVVDVVYSSLKDFVLKWFFIWLVSTIYLFAYYTKG